MNQRSISFIIFFLIFISIYFWFLHISFFLQNDNHRIYFAENINYSKKSIFSTRNSITPKSIPPSIYRYESLFNSSFNKSYVKLKYPLFYPKYADKCLLFIGILSRSSNFDRRMAQRLTFFQFEDVKSGVIQIKFIIADDGKSEWSKSCADEQNIFEDLIFLHEPEAYRYLLTKKTIHGISYFVNETNCMMMFKSDDDTFLYIPRILDLAQSANSNKPIAIGAMMKHAMVYRHLKSKYHVSFEEYNKTSYPPLLMGPGYILSRRLAILFTQMHSYQKILPIEDAYISIVIENIDQQLVKQSLRLMKKSQQLKTQSERVDRIIDNRLQDFRCSDDMLVGHQFDVNMIFNVYQNILNEKTDLCEGLTIPLDGEFLRQYYPIDLSWIKNWRPFWCQDWGPVEYRCKETSKLNLSAIKFSWLSQFHN